MSSKNSWIRRLPLVLVFVGIEANINDSFSVSITRHNKGDTFAVQGADCYQDFCVAASSGTAGPTDSSICKCRCLPNLPVFRDDLNICVNDIKECPLTSFLSGATLQKVPYVFLPLKGQIVYPSAEIEISEAANPICVISGAQFLGRRGWVQLRNNSDIDLPFRLLREEGRTYLQWLGEGDLRIAMEGRLIMVNLMCKDASGEEEQKIFTPCIVFRVAGNPSGVREMMFTLDRNPYRGNGRTLSVSEFVAVGVCVVLLALMYVAAVFLYLYYRKKKKKEKVKKNGNETHLAVAEEGIVKSNPLLQATRRHLAAVAGQDNGVYNSDSGSCCSETDRCSDIMLPDEDNKINFQNMEIAAMVHPCTLHYDTTEVLFNQDVGNIEKLPEENVSIVETLESKEDRPETVRTMASTNVRRKLYFNPAYFELDMLKAPPPAALEFLTKIREVIAIAKHKMSAKKFSPSLNGIPEEEYYSRAVRPNSLGNRSKSTSILSFTSNTRNKSKAKSSRESSSENMVKVVNASYGLTANVSCCPNDAKQRIIRKWLEDVPFLKSFDEDDKINSRDVRLDCENIPEASHTLSEVTKIMSDKIILVKSVQEGENTNKIKTSDENFELPLYLKKKENRNVSKQSTKGLASPRPPAQGLVHEKKSVRTEGIQNELVNSVQITPPNTSDVSIKTHPFIIAKEKAHPLMETSLSPLRSIVNKTDSPKVDNFPACIIQRENADTVPRVQGKDKVPPVVAKTLMDAVIEELIVQRRSDKNPMLSTERHTFVKKNMKTDFDIVHDKNTRNQVHINAAETADTIDNLKEKIDKTNETFLRDACRNITEISPHRQICDNFNSSQESIEEIDSCIDVYSDGVGLSKNDTIDSIIEKSEKTSSQDDHDYEVILLNPQKVIPENETKNKDLKIYNLPELLSKNDKNEGYSLVSEVYVNDGYNYSSDASSQSNASDPDKLDKIRWSQGDNPSRLTIYVKDSPDNYKHIADEMETFEPDTLDRKPLKFRRSKVIGTREDCLKEQYSNQRFHEMDLECKHNSSLSSNGNGEHFIDSLERPHIALTSSGSFRRQSLDDDIGEVMKNLCSKTPHEKQISSLREIFEAKSKTHRRTIETASLVGSIPSDVECNSTLSWREDRRHKLLHRGIVLHANGETRKHRRIKPKSSVEKTIFPDVVPPRPPKSFSVTTSNQRSIPSTPEIRSHCPSPTSHSTCLAASTHFLPLPPPPPPPRSKSNALRILRSRSSSPPVEQALFTPSIASRSVCSSPILPSGRSSPSKVNFSPPPPPPRFISSSSIQTCQNESSALSHTAKCIPPPPRITSGVKLSSVSLTQTICPIFSFPSWTPCSSNVPPPRFPSKQIGNSPPLPPRDSKPPLPPKNAKSPKQRKFGTEGTASRHSSKLARRPLPPVPTQRHYQDSTLSSVSSRDFETLSTLSGASLDSLNSSDYEAFYTLPFDGNEGEIYDKAQRRFYDVQNSIQIIRNSYDIDTINSGAEVILSLEEDSFNRSKNIASFSGQSNSEDSKDPRTEIHSGTAKSWCLAKENEYIFPYKPEDSGYLSTDSESGRKEKNSKVDSLRDSKQTDTNGSQGSETEESLCDGASESGAESIATDSFFFGNFNKVKAAESLDSGLGSEVNKNYPSSCGAIDIETEAESRNQNGIVAINE